jgi:hypothetical protein
MREVLRQQRVSSRSGDPTRDLLILAATALLRMANPIEKRAASSIDSTRKFRV